ncbi:MAG: formylglycine-generating enzyme family protein [Planctomycetota bacterium]
MCLRNAIVAVVLLALAGAVARVHAEVLIDMVTVGDPGNAADTRYDKTGYGGVDYVYSIGKYEVTNAQYAEFLNAVAARDPNGLYNIRMGDTGWPCGGITRSFTPIGTYTYSPIVGRGNMPVNWVSWYDTLRFANWLHNGQPSGAQDPSTTEDGAYDMSLGSDVVRKPGAQVFLPSEDEWYKAAYYKGGSPNAGYWLFPTQSNEHVFAQEPPGLEFVYGAANYQAIVGDFTYVGSYTARPSDSAYGTFDQGGNAAEWNEALIGSSRCLRGGSYFSSNDDLCPYARVSYDAAEEWNGLGFRVAGIAVLDGDRDVDLDDFARLQAAFTGPR